MKVLRQETVPPAGHFAAQLKRNQVLRIVDVQGQQVADLVCFKLDRLQEKLSVMNTISLNRQTGT